jgi:hypothetical protein
MLEGHWRDIEVIHDLAQVPRVLSSSYGRI